MVAREPDRFLRVSMGNTGLPYNPEVPKVIEEIEAFRSSNIKLHPLSMAEISKMDSGENHLDLNLCVLENFCWDTEDLPIGFIQSMQLEKRPLFP